MKVVFLLVFLVLTPFAVLAEDLCKVDNNAPHDMGMSESFFKDGAQALESAEKIVWTNLRGHQKTEQVLQDVEGFGIPFPNLMRKGIGSLLKQRALHLKYKWLANQGKKSDFEDAQKKFCDFVRQSVHAD